MRLSHFVSIVTMVFLSFPFILFYYAFYSGSKTFKDSVNNHVELYYLTFMVMAITFSAIVTKFLLDRNKINIDKKVFSLLLLKVIIVIYGILLVLNSTSRFVTYKSEAIDVMFFKQEIWQLSAFDIPEYAWAQHFSPILLFFVPLFWLSKSGTFLMFIQAVVVVSGAIPLYFVVKEKLQSQLLGLAIVISYLTFGGLQFGYAYGFHEILFFPPLFFWTYYFFVKRHFKLYFLFVLLCLTVKEEVSFIMIFFGFYLIYKKNYHYAIGTILFGVLWYILSFHIIFPHFNNGVGYGYWGQYPNVNSKGILGIISFALFQPLEFLKTLVTPKYKVDTIFHSFGHFSFLSFFSLPSLFIVIPSLLQKLLSDNIAAKNGFHYSAAITAVILISTVESIFSIQRIFFAKLIKNRNAFLGIIIIYVAFSANMLYGYHPLSPLLLGKEGGLSDQQLWILNRTIDVIPPDASVAAQYYIRSHINKPYWQTFDGPRENETADYAIINTHLPLVMAERENLEKNVSKLVQEGRYEVVVNEGGTILLKRK